MKLLTLFRRKPEPAPAPPSKQLTVADAHTALAHMPEEVRMAVSAIIRDQVNYQVAAAMRELGQTIDNRIAERTSMLAVAGQELQGAMSTLSGRIQRLERPDMPPDGEPGSGTGVFPRPGGKRAKQAARKLFASTALTLPVHERRAETLEQLPKPSKLPGRKLRSAKLADSSTGG